MAIVHVLDDYFLGITALITIAYQLIFFSIAFTLQFDKLTDFAGGTNFVILAIVTLSLGSSSSSGDGAEGRGGGETALYVRQIVVSVLLIVWALRLSGFLLFRILKTGSDHRFDGMRDSFFPFLGFWIFQMLWVWTVSLPVTVLNSPAVVLLAATSTSNDNSSSNSNNDNDSSTPKYYPQKQQHYYHHFGTGSDVAGVVLYAVGLSLEVVSDAQRYRFRTTHDGKAVCDGGLFAFSRHPNYFGEILIHFSIYMIAVSSAADGTIPRDRHHHQAYNALYATVLGPMFITFLLLFVSGLPLSERPKSKARYEQNNNWDAYKRWLDRTSILIPLPPQLYEKVPTFLKRTVLLEFPMYVFDPAKHSDGVAAKSGGPAAAQRSTPPPPTQDNNRSNANANENAETLATNRGSDEETLI